MNLLDPTLFATNRLEAALEEARRRGVFWHQSFWAITRHEDIVQVLRDDEHFTSTLGTHPNKQRPRTMPVRPLNNMDGKGHREIRAALHSHLLTDEALIPAIDAVKRVLAEKLSASAPLPISLDVAADLGPAIARAAVFTWIGIPEDEWKPMARRVRTSHRAGALVLATPENDPRAPRRAARAKRAKESLYELLRALVAPATPEPTPASVGKLRPPHANYTHPKSSYLWFWKTMERRILGEGARGLALDEETAHVSLLTSLVEAGIPTIADAIAGGALALTQERAARLEAIDVELHIRTITNELLRLASPILCFARWCVKDVKIGGEIVRAGQQVVLFFASGNRDERVFSGGGEVDLLRDPNPHLAFGFGPHACIGARLARATLDTVWRSIFPLFVRGARVTRALPRRSAYLLGFDSLVIELEERRRLDVGG